MTDTGIVTNSSDPPSHIDSIITTLTSQMTEALSKVQVSTSTIENSNAPISIKLDDAPISLNRAAYAHVCRKALRQAVMSTSDPDNTSDVVLTTKGLKLSSTNTNSIAVSSHGKSTTASKSQTVPDGMKCFIVATSITRDAGHVFDIGNYGSNLVTSSYDIDRGAWILDSGATNHMTFATIDFTMTSPPRRTSVANANGVVSPVTGDILTKEIIGRGTKREGLYYMEDVSTCHVHQIQIHSDVWGPSPISIGSGVRWFVIFVDDCTHMTWLYLMKHKDEVLHVFQSFHAMIQTQFSSKLRFSALIMVVNMLISVSILISNTMDLFMRHRVLKTPQ
ncbi:hypothetical protein CK203_039236 [Vitis vinifera]|uniref:Retrovirus-related Pol polyprotein from transposon RE2 n=1 Tax=Vitis vinifera TaxID=29760 RepID=A0A438H7D0_VITVI|nr:hypothetical protein CK203_039236 [Vitis vinifera]